MKKKVLTVLSVIGKMIVMGACAALGLYETICLGIVIYTLIT